MATYTNPFTSTTGTTLWNSLLGLRNVVSGSLQADLESLDRRIAAFESATISNLGSTGTSANYPYDREGLKREFLQDVLAILLQTTTTSAEVEQKGNKDLATEWVISAATGVTGQTTFDNVAIGSLGTTYLANQTYNNVTYVNTSQRTWLSTYSSLIDAAFAEGDKLANAPIDQAQVVTAVPPLTIGDIVYDRVATYSDMGDTSGGNPLLTQYLVPASVENAKVSSGTGMVGTSSSSSLLLNPVLATYSAVTKKHALPSTSLSVVLSKDPITGKVTGAKLLRSDNTAVTATQVPFPLTTRGYTPEELTSFRATVDGVEYMFGVDQTGTKVYGVNLQTTSPLGPVKSLSATEYLLHFNEARIQVLRGMLTYRENIITEIQQDLREANAALAELEKQVALIGTSTSDTSVETTALNLFNAKHSTAGTSLMSRSSNDSVHKKSEWDENRVRLRNYIDRRSTEAQQATLDYQNTLNRYNSAYEVMAKLQEKLDNLLKTQLRNLA